MEEDFCGWVNFPLYYSLHLGNMKEEKEYKKAFNSLKIILSGKTMYIYVPVISACCSKMRSKFTPQIKPRFWNIEVVVQTDAV